MSDIWVDLTRVGYLEKRFLIRYFYVCRGKEAGEIKHYNFYINIFSIEPFSIVRS